MRDAYRNGRGLGPADSLGFVRLDPRPDKWLEPQGPAQIDRAIYLCTHQPIRIVGALHLHAPPSEPYTSAPAGPLHAPPIYSAGVVGGPLKFPLRGSRTIQSPDFLYRLPSLIIVGPTDAS